MTGVGQNQTGAWYDEFFRRIDAACGVDPNTDHERAIKFRMLLFLSVVCTLMVGVTLISAFSLSSSITPAKSVGLVAFVAFALIPALAIALKQLILPAALFSVLSLGFIITACFLNGGLAAHFVVNLPIAAVIAGWLINTRAAVAAGALSALAIIVMGTDIGAPWVKPTALDAAQMNFMRMATATITIFSAVALVHCYQLISRQALKQVKTSRDVADRANRAKTDFLANMSHELRTPLNGVVAVAGTLARTNLQEQQREMANLIVSSGQTLERLLTDILDVSKVESGRLEIEKISFDLKQVFEGTLDLFRAAATEKGLTLAVSFGPHVQGLFLGDPTRISQIVSNLLSNAVKFTSAGRVTLHVDVEQDREGIATVQFCVTDTGIGFDHDRQASLFQPFSQEDSSINRRFGGTGLGLFISKSLLEAMGGDLSAESKKGVGSRFDGHFQIERSMVTPDDEGGRDTTVREDPMLTQEDAPKTPLRVLLAEDHPTNRRIVELILAPIGVDIAAFENGEDALEAFKAGAFDLVLMDMQMPGMDGLVATRKIREYETLLEKAPTPIAMLTANAMPSQVEAARKAGADKHISKPVTPDGLISDISELLKKCGRSKGLAA